LPLGGVKNAAREDCNPRVRRLAFPRAAFEIPLGGDKNIEGHCLTATPFVLVGWKKSN